MVVNGTASPIEHTWAFTQKEVKKAYLYESLQKVSEVEQEKPLLPKSHGRHVLVEK